MIRLTVFWTAFVKDNNVFVRLKDNDEAIQLSTDGPEGSAYGRFSWTPDSRTLVAFRDVCWKNLKDAGFPGRILWHQAAAKKYPYYDISRLGVYGNSTGGQNAAGAVLFHPELYKAAVASCGCHDNRMDKASWNEQWMGYPVGPQYSLVIPRARHGSGGSYGRRRMQDFFVRHLQGVEPPNRNASSKK